MEVLGIELFDKGLPKAVEKICAQDSSGKPVLVSATGAHGIIEAKKNGKFRKILQSFDINLPDGMPSVVIGRMKGAKDMTRCYGPEVFANVLRSTADKEITHFLCGGKSGVAEELKTQVERKFKNHNIVGTYSPPFHPIEKFNFKEIGMAISSTNPDIIWIGLSTPKQEQFAYHLAPFVKAKMIITVGAAFDFHIGSVTQAPKWIQNLSMEWFFRLMMEPKRLWKRYFEIVPKFIFYNLKELIVKTS